MTLRHELAHVKRADWLTQTLAQVVRAIYWFHPLVWLAHGRMRMEADRASDDMVLRAGVKASGYAGHLVRVAREFRTAGLRPWVAIAMAHPSSLDQRIEYVLDDGIERGALGSRARLGIALSAAAIVFAVSSVEAVGQSAVQDQQPGSAPVVALTTPDRAQHEIVAAPSHEELPALAADAQWTRLEVDTALLAQAQTTPEKPALGSPDKKPTAGDAKPKPRYAAEIADKIQDLKRRNEQPALSPEATNTAAAALRKALNSPDVQVRKHAAEALGRLRSADEANLEALSKALNDKEPEVQKEAIESLSRLMRASKADPARMVALLATAVTSSDAGVRQEAAQALGRLRGPAAVEALTKLVDDKDVEVQREAIESLGRVLRRSDAAAARASLPVLQRALQHQNPEVRRQLVETLGGLRQIADEVVPLLAKAAEDPDPNVQREAVEALGRISSRDKFEYVGEDWDDDNSIGDSIHQGIEKAIEGAIEGTIEGAIENAVPIDYLIEHDKFIQNQERVLRQLEKNQWFRDNNEKRLKDLQSRAAGNE